MGASWSANEIGPVEYTCGWCDRAVSSSNGWLAEHDRWHTSQGMVDRWVYITICPNCRMPTYHEGGQQLPGVPAGEAVEHLPDDVAALYHETRTSIGHGNYTAAGMAGRKVLMHVAVAQGAEEGRSFAYYVDYLVDEGIVTGGMKDWVDEIRQLGNDANHEIQLMAPDDAEALLTFLAMLLKIVYEFPARARKTAEARAAKGAAAQAPAG